MSGILLRQQEVFSSYPSPPQPAGCVTATPLHWLLSKKISCAFFIESALRRTEPNEAAYAITGDFKGIHRKVIFIRIV